MNVNPESAQFCDVKPWDSLTDAEKASGDWFQLPNVFPGDVSQARRRSVAEEMFGTAKRVSDEWRVIGKAPTGRR